MEPEKPIELQEPIVNCEDWVLPGECGDKNITIRRFSKRTSSFYKSVFNESRLLKELDQRAEMLSVKNASVLEEKRDNAIAADLRSEVNREHLALKHFQRLRDNSLELRELRRQINAAADFKKLKEQCAELEAKREERQLQRKREDEENRETVRQYREEQLQWRRDDILKKQQHRQVLLEQISVKEKGRRLVQDKELKDRIKLDDMAVRYEQMDAEERQQEKRQKIQQRSTLENLMDAKQKQLNDFAERERREIERADALQAKREQERAEKNAERRRKLEEKEAHSMRIGLKLQAEREDKMNKDRVLEDLLIQEKKFLADEKLNQDTINQQLYRRNLTWELEENNRAIELRKFMEKERLEAERIETERQRITQQREERERTFYLREKRRQQIRDALSESMERQNAARALQVAEHKAYELAEKQNNAERDLDIANERLRILQQTPKSVLMLMKGGILSEEDRRKLGLLEEEEEEQGLCENVESQ